MYTYPASLSFCILVLTSVLSGQSTAGAVRWTQQPGKLLYHADSVALGDDCGTAIVAKSYRDSSVSVFSATAPTPASELASKRDNTAVAAAAHDSLVVRAYARQLAGTTSIVGAVEAYESWSTSRPLWRYDYPFRFAGVLVRPFVMVSRDGSRVVSVWGDPATRELFVDSFRRDGTRLNTTVVKGTWWAISADASNDVSTVALRVTSGLVVIDTVAGRIEFQSVFSGGASPQSDSISVSGDGQRVAYGRRLPGEVGVFDRRRKWAAINTMVFGNVYVDYVDLNANGERLAFVIQDQFFRRFDTVLYDLGSAKRLFTQTTSAPLSLQQLAGSGIEVDDAGDTVAVISWGDSSRLTPQIQCFDHTGRTVYSQKTSGSCLAMDLSADGRVLLVGNADKHRDALAIASSEVHYIDLEAPGLAIQGLPRAGHTLQLEVTPPAGNSPPLLALGLEVLSTPLSAPFAGWLLHPGKIAAVVPVASRQRLPIPVPAGHDGLGLYWQAASVTKMGVFDASFAITTRISR